MGDSTGSNLQMEKFLTRSGGNVLPGFNTLSLLFREPLAVHMFRTQALMTFFAIFLLITFIR
jgi:hypothetical protein